jgi:iron complex transport system ATP-binding protein
MTDSLSIENVSVRYGAHTAVSGVSVEIAAGEVTAIVGPNGCGKSTLLRTMARLLSPPEGRVRLDGEDVQRISPRRFATRVALLPQAPIAPDNLTVIDLVARGRDPHRRWFDQWSKPDEAIITESLERTGMAEFANRSLESLSGGQRQRAWIALALAQQTEVLLLDEPTTYLDIAHQIEVLDTIRAVHAEKTVTVVMVMHDLSMAARYSDHLLAMRSGQLVAAGSVAEVVTPDTLRDVFGVECTVLDDPESGRPIVIPRTLVER